MTDRFDLLCRDVRRVLHASRDPELRCRPEEIVILPGRGTGMLSCPSAIAMVPSRRTDPGKFAGNWVREAGKEDTGYVFSSGITGYIDIAVSHRRTADFLYGEKWPKLPAEPMLADDRGPMFFVFFLRERLASLEDSRLTDDAEPVPHAWELDWHLLRGTHMLSRVRPALAAEWAVRAKELFETYFAAGGALSRPRIAAMDALLAQACRKYSQNR